LFESSFGRFYETNHNRVFYEPKRLAMGLLPKATKHCIALTTHRINHTTPAPTPTLTHTPAPTLAPAPASAPVHTPGFVQADAAPAMLGVGSASELVDLHEVVAAAAQSADYVFYDAAKSVTSCTSPAAVTLRQTLMLLEWLHGRPIFGHALVTLESGDNCWRQSSFACGALLTFHAVL
jgi:hypothetical protein